MIKKRIIPIQLLINNRLVKTVNFDSYRDVGNPVTSSRVYCDQDADELVFLNINREKRCINELIELLKKVSEECFMPLSIGGGITCLKDAEKLIINGADKVVLNSICYKNTDLITEIADKFGSQAVVVSIDVKKEDNDYKLYSNCGRRGEDRYLEEHIYKCTEAKAGEILINSIDKDGTMSGYDIDLIESVMKYTTLPVIGCGGSGNTDHLKEAFLKTDVSALACGSIFNFADNNPLRAKAALSNCNIPLKQI